MGLCVAGLLCPAVGPGLLASASADAPRDFTAAERKRLAAGGLVERRVVKRKGGLDLMGGTSWQVIKAPPDVIWEALLDTQYYPRMMPRVLEARRRLRSVPSLRHCRFGARMPSNALPFRFQHVHALFH